uniref:Uncharacterized protein MANES_01G102100 n=1 Tax=Rhizophora mucronata TaxID=61149 RepID=A0A2P2MH32_RHIMU
MAKVCFSMSLSSRRRLFLAYLLHLLHAVAAAKKSPAYTPTDLILLNCGTNSRTTSLDGRSWDGDERSKFLASSTPQASGSALAAEQENSILNVPYMTARVIHSAVSYTFRVLPGPKFLRLYFYPATYFNLSGSKSFFSLTANNYKLLSNFSAYLRVSAMEPSFVKEFIIPVTDSQMLNVTFLPSPGSFAFINGIEIVSMPNDLYGSSKGELPTYVGVDHSFYLENSLALENLYRLNVGGGVVSVLEDTGMYRTWLQDSDYIFAQQSGTAAVGHDKIVYTNSTPAYTAPQLVYGTMRSMGPHPEINKNYNLTWNFSVDAGFTYLVRLHFCETRKEVTSEGEIEFFIFINNQTAEDDADVIHWSGNRSTPVYKDYVVWVPEGISILWLALAPNLPLSSPYADAFLNGLEIFKLNKSDGSLAGRNPHPLSNSPPMGVATMPISSKSESNRITIVTSVVGSVSAIIVLSLVFYLYALRQKRQTNNCDKREAKSSWIHFSYPSKSFATSVWRLPSNSNLCRRFSIFEIEVATCRFDDEYVIGSGGFGNVYKGYIDEGVTPVAIKRLHSSSGQGVREFRTEIKMLSSLCHVNLVALIGYCDDQGEMILVYEYMSRGTLRDHLYKTQNPPLPWKRRLEICIGSARGLQYLHTGTRHTIIHRDVKSTNILLGENWMAKVSDFGLSRAGPTSDSQTHVSTVVRGSIGYVDPDYFRRKQLTEKSDVYSFGVVLFEVLCARPAVMQGLPREQVSLADWARNCHLRGFLDRIMDPYLRGQIAPLCLKRFGEIAYGCVSDQAAQRPAITDVVWGLEFALQLQEAAETNINRKVIADLRVSVDQESPLLLQHREGVIIATDDDDPFSGSGVQMSDSRSTVSSSEIVTARQEANELRSKVLSLEIRNLES